ncbi:MAG TPA: cupin domain-containing protein [Alphaproteobacteria bacterium]|nr:cupin domain-containing protein [Alphaproteobacteria bacterium]
MNKQPTLSDQSHVVSSETLQKIKLFLDQESKKLSSAFPYCLDLYKDGKIDENKAGVRYSETAQQFDDLGLSGLLFYYKLYDHSMRVPHWHANAIEVGVVLTGKMKITIWDGLNKPRVFTVEKNGTWLIPQASLHALENVGDVELDFIVVYNSPNAADRDFVTAWAALPDTLLERSLGLLPEEITALKKSTNNRLSSYDPESIPEERIIPDPFTGNFFAGKPLYESELGSIRRIDADTNPAMESMALQQTLLNPGAIREPHWYTTGDAVLFVNKGTAFFTMMNHEGTVYNVLINPGDLIFIPVGTFHTYVNVSTDVLEIYEAFNASKGLAEVTLLSGAKHFSAGTLAGATGLSKEVAEKILKLPVHDYMTSL